MFSIDVMSRQPGVVISKVDANRGDQDWLKTKHTKSEIIGRGSYPESSDLVRSGSSYGVGEALLFGFSRARRVVIGLGGTAINDGGAGLLAALGASANVRLDQGGIGLAGIKELNMARACEAVAGCEILIATDVDNPLTGPQGASEMYAPQKGATPADVRELEAHLLDY